VLAELIVGFSKDIILAFFYQPTHWPSDLSVRACFFAR